MTFNKGLSLKLNQIKNSLLPFSHEKMVISVSGGIDSMSLLHFLHNLNFDLVVVHFNHHKRDNSIKEEELVRSFCKKLKLTFYVFDIKITKKTNFQAAARKQRYNYLKQVCTNENCHTIITAHHLNDLCENTFLGITRGLKPTTKLGIRSNFWHQNFLYLRPFLLLTRDEIIAYQKYFQVPFLNDESNFENNYTRNKIRNCIIPLLLQDNPNLVTTVTQFTKRFDDLNDFVVGVASQELEKIIRNNTLDFNLLSVKNELIINYIISLYTKQNNIIVTSNTISQITKAIISHNNTKLRVTKNLYLKLDYLVLSIFTDKTSAELDNYEVLLYNPKNIQNNKIYYSHNQINDYFTSGMIKYYNNIKFPLYVRYFKPGDTVKFAYGTKKLSRFFIDKKIPESVRKTLPIVCDSDDKILWIPHYYLNQELKGERKLYLYLLKNEKN